MVVAVWDITLRQLRIAPYLLIAQSERAPSPNVRNSIAPPIIVRGCVKTKRLIFIRLSRKSRPQCLASSDLLGLTIWLVGWLDLILSRRSLGVVLVLSWSKSNHATWCRVRKEEMHGYDDASLGLMNSPSSWLLTRGRGRFKWWSRMRFLSCEKDATPK